MCHDNGYVPALNEAITNGHQNKLILLPGYSEITPNIQKLGLPTHVVPDLFETEKILLSNYGTPNNLRNYRSLPINHELGSPPLPSFPLDSALSDSDEALDPLSTFPPPQASRSSSFSGGIEPRGSALGLSSSPKASPSIGAISSTGHRRNVSCLLL